MLPIANASGNAICRLDGDWYRSSLPRRRVRAFHYERHTALTNLAASGASLFAVLGTPGQRSPRPTKQYVQLASVVFADEAAALERRLLGVQDPGTTQPEAARLSGSA